MKILILLLSLTQMCHAHLPQQPIDPIVLENEEFLLRRINQGLSDLKALSRQLQNSLIQSVITSVVVSTAINGTIAYKWSVDNDGALRLDATGDSIDYDYIPLAPFGFNYYYKIDAATDGAFETDKVAIGILFPDLLFETPNGLKIYRVGVTYQGALTSDLYGVY